MIVYFRLFAGFTSFKSNRCWSHRFSIGPDGVFDLSSISLHQASQHSYGYGDEAGDEDPGKNGRESLDQRRVTRMAQAHRLEHTPDAMAEMKTDQNHYNDVNQREWNNEEPRDEILIRVEFNKLRMNGTGR